MKNYNIFWLAFKQLQKENKATLVGGVIPEFESKDLIDRAVEIRDYLIASRSREI